MTAPHLHLAPNTTPGFDHTLGGTPNPFIIGVIATSAALTAAVCYLVLDRALRVLFGGGK